MNSYFFISEIYRLLGEVNEDLIEQTLRMPIPTNIRSLIAALANAKKEEKDNLQADEQRPNLKIQKTAHSSSSPTNKPISFRQLLTKTKKMTNTELFLFFKKAGLTDSCRTKDSRPILEQKIEKAFKNLSSADKISVFNLLSPPLSETEGWINAIRNARTE